MSVYDDDKAKKNIHERENLVSYPRYGNPADANEGQTLEDGPTNYDPETGHSKRSQALQGNKIDDLEQSFGAQTEADKQPAAENPSKQPKKASVKNFLTSKRGIAAVGGTGLVGSLIVFFVSFLGGPLQLMHLANALDRTSQPTESMMRTRSGSLLRNARAAKTGDIGESRVSRIGSRVFSNAQSQLSDIGVEFTDRSGRTGRPGNMNINTNDHPQFRNLPEGQRRAAVARHYGVNPNRISVVSGSAGSYSINLQGYSAGAVRALLDTSLRPLEDGRIKTAMNKRVMAKFFNVPSLFRPFQRAQADAEQRLDTRAQRRQAERERKSTKRPRLSAKYQSAIDTARSRLSGWSGRIAVLTTLQGVYCNIYTVRELLPLINYAQVVVPASIESIDKRAVPAQLQASEEITLNDAGQVVDSFTYDAEEAIAEIGEENLDIEDIERMRADDGKSIWSGKALNALVNNSGGEGDEIDPGYKLAFAGRLEGEKLTAFFEGSAAGSISCSTAGLVVGGVLGTALAFVPVAGWKARAAIAGGQTLMFAAITSIVTNIVIDRVSENAMEVFSGPQGGNLLAYGARASNNMNAQSMGGVELTDTQTAALLDEAHQKERLELAERSFAQRIFDVTDYRSLTAKVFQSVNATFEQGVFQATASMLNPIRLFSSIANSFTSITRADTSESYDWGFPVYGIPMEILEDDRYEDPYYNASLVADKLDKAKDAKNELAQQAAGDITLTNQQASSRRQTVNYMERVTERAEVCFGIVLREQSSEWVVLRDEAVNPLEEDYIDAECNNLSDLSSSHSYGPMDGEDWIRMILFVFDNAIVTALDCYEGDRSSCNDIGVNPTSSERTSNAPISDENGFLGIDTSGLTCPPGSTDMGVVQVPTAENLPSSIQQTSIRLCDIPGITTGTNVVIAEQVISLLAAAEQDGLSLSGSNFRSSERQAELRIINGCPDVFESPSSACRIPTARPGNSMHEHGLAIDFVNCGTRGTRCYQWLDSNAANFGLINLPSEPWHWSTNGR